MSAVLRKLGRAEERRGWGGMGRRGGERRGINGDEGGEAEQNM